MFDDSVAGCMMFVAQPFAAWQFETPGAFCASEHDLLAPPLPGTSFHHVC